MGKLSEKKVRSLTKPGKYGDGDNLWLIIGPTGRKRWEFRYTLSGRSHEMSLGSTEDRDIYDARDESSALRRVLRSGGDPVSARVTEMRPAQMSFAQVAENCISSLKAGWSNHKSEAQWRSSLEAHAFPKIGNLPVASISTSDVFNLLEPIWNSTPETASRVRQRIEKVLDFATALKLRTGENPARLKGNLDHILPKRAKMQSVRHHPALPYFELGDFIAELRHKQGIAPRALEFAILTAARTSEVLGARWSEIDIDKRVWQIPAERMKARRDHRVPLTEAALVLLESLPRDTEGDFVFISTSNSGKAMSNMAMLKTLKLMDRSDLTVHGFRSTFRDWAAETTAYPDTVVEMALAHTVGNAVEAAYRRGDLFNKRVHLMAEWSKYCSLPSPAGANVIPIRA